jgi:hypothetical protein
VFYITFNIYFIGINYKAENKSIVLKYH